MTQDEENHRASKDNTDRVYKPDDMRRPNVSPEGTLSVRPGLGGSGLSLGGAGAGSGAKPQPSFEERFSETPEQSPQEQDGRELFIETDDPEVNRFYEEEMNQRPISQEEIDAQSNADLSEVTSEQSPDNGRPDHPEPVDIPENRRSFSERFDIETPDPDKGQDGPDLSRPGRDDGPDIER